MENTSTETPVGLDVEWILEGVDLVSECGDVCFPKFSPVDIKKTVSKMTAFWRDKRQ
jgi:hypothetical protein